MKKLNELKKSKKGFTLIELIIVIAILGVLAAILVPSLIGTVADSKEKVAKTNAQTLYTTAQASFVTLITSDADVAEVVHKSGTAGTDPFVAQVEKDLGNNFGGKTWTVETDANGVVEVTYDGEVYPKSTASTASTAS